MHGLYRSCVLLLLIFSFLTGCAASNKNSSSQTTQAASAANVDARFEDDYETEEILLPDPLYPWNRFWFTFNDYAINYLVRPVYTAYDFVTPDPVQKSIGNFFNNLMFPVRFVNSVLQLKFMQAGVEMSRFVLNSTYGLGGLFDPAADKEPIVRTDDEDFGQTLGSWGVGEGLYLVLPIFGPSTPRDTIGMVGDYLLDPLAYVSPYGVAYGLRATRQIDKSGKIIKQYDDVTNISVDPYAAMRDAYIKYRRNKVER